MENKFIVLYRYHKDFDLVLERLKLIKLIDPEIRLFGMYGGAKEMFPEAKRFFADYFVDNYYLNVEDVTWKWLQGDISYQMWYNDVGINIDFDFMVSLEWDLLYLEKIENLFPQMKRDEVRVTGLIPLQKVSRYWYWCNKNNFNRYKRFVKEVGDTFGQSFEEYAMLGPGVCFSKSFLDDLNKIELFGTDIIDEMKIPIWAQILGYKLISNNFYRNWFSFFEQKVFNANNFNINLKTIGKHLNRRNGRRAFHPFRDNISSEALYSIYLDSIRRYGNRKNNKQYSVKSIKSLCVYSFHRKLSKILVENKHQ